MSDVARGGSSGDDEGVEFDCGFRIDGRGCYY